MLSGAMLAAPVSGAVAREVDQAGLDRAREALAPYAALPVFTPPAEPFDARACAEGRRTLSIPNTSANPFLKRIIDRMKAAGEQVGLEVVECENRGQPSQSWFPACALPGGWATSRWQPSTAPPSCSTSPAKARSR